MREMQITMSGQLTGAYQVIYERGASLCGGRGRLAGDSQSIDYVLNGHVEGEGQDIGVEIELGVHHYSGPGKFRVGSYPQGSPGAPAIASVEREITPRNIVSWISDSGTLVIDSGAMSGALDIHLTSASGLGDLEVQGSWLCSQP